MSSSNCPVLATGAISPDRDCPLSWLPEMVSAQTLTSVICCPVIRAMNYEYGMINEGDLICHTFILLIMIVSCFSLGPN